MNPGIRVCKRDCCNNRVFSVILTLIVIGLLLFSMPVKAFDLSLSAPSNSNPTQGEIITFSANVTISNAEIVPLESIKIVFKNSLGVYENCTFNLSNNSETSCSFLNVSFSEEDVSHTYGYSTAEFNSTNYYWGYGYGYGYTYSPNLGNAVYSFDFSLNTSGLDVEQYEVWLVAVTEATNTDVTEFASNSFEFTIEEANTESQVSNRREVPCFTKWVCLDWGECANGLQERTCEKELSYCAIREEMPSLTQSCGQATATPTPLPKDDSLPEIKESVPSEQYEEIVDDNEVEPLPETLPVKPTVKNNTNAVFLGITLFALIAVIVAIALFTKRKKD